jgi:dipeptidyl aminopeptidase/acylaminoacyl peptidase
MDWTDLDAYQALPRLSGLALSPDGSRLVTSVATLDPKKQKWVSALWEVDPTGDRPAHRLTRSAKGEGGPVFTDSGDVLFVSGRPDPGKDDDEDAKVALWLLPRTGEAATKGTRPGGVSGPVTAGDTVVVLSDTLPGSTDDDAERRKARKDRKVSAILHTGYPVRFWDHDLGPGQSRFVVGSLADDTVTWRDLTPAPGRSLDEASYDLSPDGSTLITTWDVVEPRGGNRSTLRSIDLATGEARVLRDGPTHEYGGVEISPDGSVVAVIRWERSTPDDPGDAQIVMIHLASDTEQVVTGWDRWPLALTWTPDALLVTADELGASPVFRVGRDGSVTRLTTDAGAYTDVRVSPDGDLAYALRSGYDGPPAPVRLDARTPGVPMRLRGPAADLALPGELSEVTATAEDGRPLRAWLATPEGEGPHPFVLWVHGGPLGSWNAWSWRWCPWLLVAQGYAVLLPDPAMSTGYGLDHVKASWGDWGGATYTDVLALTDAALAQPDLDETRTAMMGGSFGGYMANWIAGHTDRFQAIVTHASLWGLERFGGTTDAAWYWQREMTPEMIAKNDPSRHLASIVTPMLVIHGDKDYRVPIGEALALWWDLCSQAPDPAAMPHRFLYFPDENHWVLTPGHSVVWYQSVLSFLGWHVLGCQEEVPDLLT